MSEKTPCEIIQQFGETQQTASKKETGHTANVHCEVWKTVTGYIQYNCIPLSRRQIIRIDMSMWNLFTQQIGDAKYKITFQLHLWIFTDAPLQVWPEKPDPRTLIERREISRAWKKQTVLAVTHIFFDKKIGIITIGQTIANRRIFFQRNQLIWWNRKKRWKFSDFIFVNNFQVHVYLWL